jgi:ABC-type nitrate/sulfonate/bicarbonate transport system substrate-binding protein
MYGIALKTSARRSFFDLGRGDVLNGKRLPQIVLFLFAAAFLSASSAVRAAESKLETINVSFSSLSPTRLHLWMARDLGLFEKQGLDVKLVFISGGPTSLQALLSGNVAIVTAGGQATIAAAAKGAPVVIFGNSHYSPYVLIAAPGITSVEALKGKTIGSSRPGAAADFTTRLILTKLNIDPNSQVTVRYTGLSNSRDRVRLMTQGIIDATLAVPEDALDFQLRGFKFNVLADSVELGAISTEDFTATDAFVKARLTTVTAFLKGVSEAVWAARANKALALNFYRRYLKLEDHRVLESTYKTNVLKAYPEKPYPRFDAIETYVESMRPTMPELKGKKAADFVNADALKSMESEGFWSKLKR